MNRGQRAVQFFLSIAFLPIVDFLDWGVRRGWWKRP